MASAANRPLALEPPGRWPRRWLLLAGLVWLGALAWALRGPVTERPARLGLLALGTLAGALASGGRARRGREVPTSEQALLEGLNAGVWRLDAQARTEHANRLVCELLGLPVEALRVRRWRCACSARTARSCGCCWPPHRWRTRGASSRARASAASVWATRAEFCAGTGALFRLAASCWRLSSTRAVAV